MHFFSEAIVPTGLIVGRLREPIHMPTIYAGDLTSDLSVYDLPLDAPDSFDDVEYAHIMRRIGIAEGEPGTSVSAFNSSI
jgi:hypothetical protein